ncbi:MAG: HD domain-containing protein [Solirubrobacterales bacterium]|nr:HD domain-containing protein [Solirubrobacterales bacterium]
MNQPALSPQFDPPALAKVFVRELAGEQAVDSVFLVRERVRRSRRNGEPYIKLKLGDVTGSLEAVAWDADEALVEASEPGAVVRVVGVFAVDPKHGPALTVRALRRAAAGEYRSEDLRDGPPVSCERMLGDLDQLVGTVQDRHLRMLIDAFLGPGTPTRERWCESPAAKTYHQAYRHGLLEHSLSVAQGVSALSSTFPGIDRDVAVTGALLHDIGKIEAYATKGEGAIDLTDDGRLQGEIALGYYLVRRAIEDLPGFPAATAVAVLHIVLSHHGRLEHGSPVVPCTREANLVHMIDNLGGRLGSFDRLEKALASGEVWSRFDPALSGPAYFARRESLDRAA